MRRPRTPTRGVVTDTLPKENNYAFACRLSTCARPRRSRLTTWCCATSGREGSSPDDPGRAVRAVGAVADPPRGDPLHAAGAAGTPRRAERPAVGAGDPRSGGAHADAQAGAQPVVAGANPDHRRDRAGPRQAIASAA